MTPLPEQGPASPASSGSRTLSDRLVCETVQSIFRHATYRFGGIHGFMFGSGRHWTWKGHSPVNKRGQREAMDDNRRAYVNDMRWMVALLRLTDPRWSKMA